MLRLLLAPAVLLGILPALAPPAPTSGPPPAPRPVVLFLHGRGFQDGDTASLRAEWREALDDGVFEVAGRRLLEDDDFRLVWYADALTANTGCPDDGPEADWPEDDRPESRARDLATVLGTAGTLMALAAEWMGGPEGEALRALAGDLRFLGDERGRCGAEERLADALSDAALEGRPVVLVAHSFGALVSYHHLRTRAPAEGPEIRRWITVGSLLGHPELRRLLLDEDGDGLPPRVGSWVNVHDPRDPFSAPLLGLDGREPPAAIENRATERSWAGDHHDPARYLVDPSTARAVLEAWCGVTGGAPESPCGTASEE